MSSPGVSSLRKARREFLGGFWSHLYHSCLKSTEWLHSMRYSILLRLTPDIHFVTHHDTAFLKPVKTPSYLHTSLDRGENQIWLNLVILSSSPTVLRAQVDVLLSSMVGQDCSELSGVRFAIWTPYTSRIASWSSRMLVREPCGTAAACSTVTH